MLRHDGAALKFLLWHHQVITELDGHCEELCALVAHNWATV